MFNTGTNSDADPGSKKSAKIVKIDKIIIISYFWKLKLHFCLMHINNKLLPEIYTRRQPFEFRVENFQPKFFLVIKLSYIRHNKSFFGAL